MRMTNKIMQNNSLYNINNTKIAEDKLTTQMTTQSKIDRPSDDPVVAIRALRLRTNVSETVQYHEKNAPDAEQWLDVTAGSLTTVTELITDMYKQAEKASNKDLMASDLKVLLGQMQAYTQEFYATGNQDYAGRYIFTGYRTDTPLTFTKAHETPYEITEPIGKDVMDSISYTDYSALTGAAPTEQDISNADLARIRLSYKDLAADPAKTYTISLTEMTGTPPVSSETAITLNSTATKEEACQALAAESTAEVAYLLPETGEILMSRALADRIGAALEEGGSASVTYDKSSWKTDDLNPQHYFRCKDLDAGIEYNKTGDVNTVINYDVGYNQKIQVNTNASEVFVHDLYRDMDDLTEAIAELEEIEKLQKQCQEELDGAVEGSSAYTSAQNRLDAVNKAYTYVRQRVQDMTTEQMTKYQNYLDMTDLAITQNGTRSSRLNMISTRLLDQKTIYKELQEDNEGIDMPEVAVNLASAKMTYDAALQATSKILQNSLMNYI